MRFRADPVPHARIRLTEHHPGTWTGVLVVDDGLPHLVPLLTRVPGELGRLIAEQDVRPVALRTAGCHYMYRRRFFAVQGEAVHPAETPGLRIATVRGADAALPATPLDKRVWFSYASGGRTDDPVRKRARPARRFVKGHREAEHLIADRMQWLGFPDAVVTPATRDGGVDVVSRGAVAQVKMEAKPIAPAPIQQLAGIAAIERKAALFFSSTAYSVAATAWADRAGVALFEWELDGELRPRNRAAEELIAAAS